MFTNSYTINKKHNYTYLSKVDIKIDNNYYYNNDQKKYNTQQINKFNIEQNKFINKIKKK